MTLREYLRAKITPYNPTSNLEMIYEELMNLGYKPHEIAKEINDIIVENINKIMEDYKKKKDENK